MSKEQKEELKKSLEEKEYWTTKEIGVLIKEKFGVEHKKSRLYELLKELGLKLSKPF